MTAARPPTGGLYELLVVYPLAPFKLIAELLFSILGAALNFLVPAWRDLLILHPTLPFHEADMRPRAPHASARPRSPHSALTAAGCVP